MASNRAKRLPKNASAAKQEPTWEGLFQSQWEGFAEALARKGMPVRRKDEQKSAYEVPRRASVLAR